MSFIVMVEIVHVDPGTVINRHKQAANRPNKLLKGHRSRIAKVKNKLTIKISLCSKLAHLTPMHEGDASWRPLKNKSQDRLIGVDFLNLSCEGLLLGMQAGGPAC
jgi:hypothetical protein